MQTLRGISHTVLRNSPCQRCPLSGHRRQGRTRLRHSAEQLRPCDPLSGDLICGVIDQNELCVIRGQLVIAVDIRCSELLLRQPRFNAREPLRIRDQCKLCVVCADLAVIVQVAGQKSRL